MNRIETDAQIQRTDWQLSDGKRWEIEGKGAGIKQTMEDSDTDKCRVITRGKVGRGKVEDGTLLRRVRVLGSERTMQDADDML